MTKQMMRRKKDYVDKEKEDTPKQKAKEEKDLEGKKDVEDKVEKEEKRKHPGKGEWEDIDSDLWKRM